MSAPVPTASTPVRNPDELVPQGLAPALLALDRALEDPLVADRPGWRWTVRQRMAAVRDALLPDVESSDDGWLAARSGGIARDRDTLLGRLSTLGPEVLESADVAPVRAELARLVTDIRHYVQRIHDLAYDAVELELGGSE